MKTKFFIKTILLSVFFPALFFVCGGNLHYLPVWVYLGTSILTGFMNFFSIRNNEELLQERSQAGAGTKSWDKKLMGLSALVYLITIILAGLDAGRFHWSPVFPPWLTAAGAVLIITGQWIFLTARSQNRFFSSLVRIQTDRGHQVCDTGLYKIVRHPGYAGMLISLAGIPLITGSLWSAIPAGLAWLLLIIRSSLEDKTLIEELDGYEEYSHKTKYKIIPLIW